MNRRAYNRISLPGFRPKKRQKEIAEAARNRKNLVGALGLYHEAAEEIREEDFYEDEMEQN